GGRREEGGGTPPPLPLLPSSRVFPIPPAGRRSASQGERRVRSAMSKEPRAVLLLLGLAVAGHAGRLLLARPGDPPGALLSVSARGDADPARQRARSTRLARPL